MMRSKKKDRYRAISISIITLAVAALELRALLEPSAESATSSFPADASEVLWYLRIGLPFLLFLGAGLCWAFSRLKALPRLSRAFSRGGFARLALVLAWTMSIALSDTFAGRSPLILLVGMVASAFIGWERRSFLAFSSIFGALAVGAVGRLAGVDLGVDGYVLLGSSAGLCIATAAMIRSAILRSADRLDSLEKENRKLWDLSFRDGLTGLYNRRYSQEVGALLFAQAKRYNEQLHALMIDIDRFKLVNDRLGHPTGDEVLKGLAEILTGQIRSSDVAMRYGGEEFLVFLVKSEPELVQFIANRIRDAVAAHLFTGVPWQVTISIGVAGIQGEDSLESLVDRADKYLYASKHAGRNRVSGF